MTSSLQKRQAPAAASSSGPQPKRSKDASLYINEDALGFVMEFLGPRELYRMAFTCKSLRSKVTTRLVVRSAIMQGGHAATTVRELYNLMNNKSIHAPSPLRLLRLVNGKRCEWCNINKLSYVRPRFGVFLCRPCLADQFTATVELMVLLQFRYDQILGAQSYAPLGNTSAIWSRCLEQNGELCGPLVTLADIERMAHISASGESMVSELPPEQDYKEFVQAYDDSQEEAKAAEQYRLEKKERSRTEAAERRKKSSLQIVSKITDLLDDPWWQFALSNTETGLTGKKPCLAFESPFCDELLRELMITPSKAKKSVIKEVAAEINRYLHSINERHLLDFSFLFDEDPFEAALKRHCLGMFPDLKSVVLSPCADRRFFEMLMDGQMLEATELLFPEHPVRLLLSADPDLHPGFAMNVWDYEDMRCQDDTSERRRRNRIFDACVKALEQLKKTVEEFCIWHESRDNEGHLHPGARSCVLRDRSLLHFLYRKDFDGILSQFRWREIVRSALNVIGD
jgi:hypothetical protein